MKEKVIEIAGKAWWALGEMGETNAGGLARKIKEKEDLVNLALGWLAREDKVSFSVKRNKVLFSLVAPELQAFKNIYQNTPTNTSKNNGKRRRLRLI